MKTKHISHVAVISIAAIHLGAAYGQSSVSIFGVMDLSTRHVNNDATGNTTSLASGGNQTSRWGIKGSEDLGGGLSAQFLLDSAIAADTGTSGQTIPAGQYFDRQSTLSLTSDALGEIRLGRDYQPAWTAMSAFDPFITNGIAGISTSTALSTTASRAINRAFGPSSINANPILRVSNSIQYFLPQTLGGFYGSLFASAREGAVNATAGSTGSVGGRLGFANGPVNITAGTLKTSDTLVTGESFRDTTFGGSYDFTIFKLLASYRTMRITTDKQATTMLAATLPVGRGTFKASYVRMNQSGATQALDSNDAHMIGLGYVYDITKRTALYTTFSRISNQGGATYSVPGGPAVGAGFAGKNSLGYEFGVRHFF